jgi:hypothetical protein
VALTARQNRTSTPSVSDQEIESVDELQEELEAAGK